MLLQSRLPTLPNGLSTRVRGIIDLIHTERDQELKVVDLHCHNVFVNIYVSAEHCEAEGG